MRDIHISIISHEQLAMVNLLLKDLEKQNCVERLFVTITINTPENEFIDYDSFTYPISVLNNKDPKGFAENHNFAFSQIDNSNERQYYIIINPDVRIYNNIFNILTEKLDENEQVGLVAPIVKNINNHLEDSIRELPTPIGIFKKLIGKRGQWDINSSLSPDWVAGMFMAFSSKTFESMKGFDERYFLYYEDVDMCSRLWLNGYTIQIDPQISIIHDAQRKSWSNIQYLWRHLNSMATFFFSDIYRNVKIFHQNRSR